jgi:hypothetical protein
MLAAIRSATVVGVEGRPVVVEVHVSIGLPAFTVVGLPDEACREARDRARAAVLSSGLEWPNRRITVNLAPSVSIWRSQSAYWWRATRFLLQPSSGWGSSPSWVSMGGCDLCQA